MTRRRHGDGNYGLSWGLPGFRIGRSQYGNWWISLGLPFGLRITKRLGRKEFDIITDNHESKKSKENFYDNSIESIDNISAEQYTKNQEILNKIKNKK